MAQHYIDPADYSAGTDVTSLFNTYGLSSTVEVTVRNDATNGNYLELFSDTGTGPTFLEHIASNADTGLAAAEVLIKQEVTAQNISLIYCVGRGNSQRDGYGASFFGDASFDWRVNRFDNGTFATLGTASNESIANGTIVWQRLQISGSTVRARIWADGDPEPETWGASGTDSTYSSGFAGLAFYTDNDRSLYHCYWLGIGTNGDTAPSEPTGGSGASVTLTGLSSSSGVGTFAATGGALLELAGIQSAVGVGDPSATAGAFATAASVLGTGAAGDASAVGGAIISLSGVQSVTSAGIITALGGASVTAQAVSATGQVGTVIVSVAGGVTATLSGVSATGAAGDLAALGGAETVLAGVSVTPGVGTFSATGSANIALSGVTAAGSTGTITISAGDTVVTLSGVDASGRVGAISVSGGARVELSGVDTTGGAGTVLGIIDATGRLVGTITIQPALSGGIAIEPALSGSVTIN